MGPAGNANKQPFLSLAWVAPSHLEPAWQNAGTTLIVRGQPIETYQRCQNVSCTRLRRLQDGLARGALTASAAERNCRRLQVRAERSGAHFCNGAMANCARYRRGGRLQLLQWFAFMSSRTNRKRVGRIGMQEAACERNLRLRRAEAKQCSKGLASS